MMPASARATLGRIALLCTLCFILSGCGKSKITKENFEKIKNDMTLQEVEAILGSGSAQGGDGGLVAAQAGVDVSGGAPPPSTVDYLWESGKKSITVSFKQGKVVAKKSSGL
ncbi:MAG TPA: hypothetical protein VKA46_24275 [Gemmataceae bacterium]|nr:hypothetical protein [Gemmataceae bacterium]